MMPVQVVLFGALAAVGSSLQVGRRATVAPRAVRCEALGRRDLMGAAAALALALPGAAEARSASSVDKALSNLGLPTMGPLPNGFAAVLETYSQNRAKPLLVRFAHPSGWLVVKPSFNTNGEAGTISAGDYGKADSATFFDFEQGDISSKTFLQKICSAGISQRGSNQYQSFKIDKVGKVVDGYASADFSYELITGAGFIIERKGTASVTSIGSGTSALIAVTTATRWKKLEPSFRTIADSFRVYETTAAAAQAISAEAD